MNSIIKVTDVIISKRLIKAVNARDLHTYLESKYQFTDWMNLFLPDFELEVDYLVFQEKLKNPKGGRPKEEFAISLDMAKHIALMSRTDKGREVRRYFIECEQRLKAAYSKDAAWLQARQDGKITRREETDTIKLFVEYATKQGSGNARMYYMAITKGVYSALYMIEKDTSWKAIRETLGTTDLQVLSTCEHVARKYIQEGMDLNMDYKDVYKYAIAKVEEMAGIIGKKQTLLSVVRDKNML